MHYVYQHTDPRTGEVIYIGHGQGPRAWSYSPNNISVGVRSEAHNKILADIAAQGYTMEDVVSLLGTSMTKDEAKELEASWIRSVKPRLNYLHNKDDRKKIVFKASDIPRLKELRKTMSYKTIADLEGTSTMTVWRTINEQ